MENRNEITLPLCGPGCQENRWAHFDALPKDIRKVLREAAFDGWCPLHVGTRYPHPQPLRESLIEETADQTWETYGPDHPQARKSLLRMARDRGGAPKMKTKGRRKR
jgi:hypothetical protein